MRSKVPVLLLSGEIDPVTPPAGAAHAAHTLSHSRHLIVSGQVHGVIGRGCVPKIAADFINLGLAPAKLDASCLERRDPPDFFLDFAGPRP